MNSAKTLFTTPGSFLLLLLAIGTLSSVESWSPSSKPNIHRIIHTDINENDDSGNVNAPTSRRQLFQASALALTAAAVVAPSAANAACLQGDLRPVCIGIYKVPLDDNILPYISTPEQLHKFAPDLTYVPPIEYPESFESAMAMLANQRAAADEIRQHVMAGKLEEAGVKVLGLIPKVTSGCRRVVADLETKIHTTGIIGNARRNPLGDGDSNGDADVTDTPLTESETTVEALAIEMAEDQMSYVTGYFGETDITIGQAIRGDLGRMTVAQLTILSSLRDATGALDDFLVTATSLSKTKAA